MSLKKLTSFQTFDSTRFFGGKDLMLSKLEEWQQGEDRDHMQTVGTKVTGVIFHDRTEYKGGMHGLNQGEALTIKVHKPASDFASWKPFNTIFRLKSVEKAVIYGDYRNKLSVVGEVVAVSGAGAPVRKAGVK